MKTTSGFLGSLNMSFFQFLILFISLLTPMIIHAADFDIEKDLQGISEKSRGVIKKMRETGRYSAHEMAALKQLLQQIKAADLILSERFRLTEERTKSVSATAHERHNAMAERFRATLEEITTILEQIPTGKAISDSSAERLEQLLDSALPKKKAQIHGTLPYKVINYPAVEPTDAPALQPAYRNGASAMVGAADLKGTPEAPIYKEIAALAQSLDWSPVGIYEWVKNNVETEWYWGGMKGAEETLRQKSGNDSDQAALLVSLMRASGYPARYVRGVIEFFPGIERVKNLTGIDDPLEIAEFFAHAGIPFKPVMSGSRIENFQIEHVWVETQVPYVNYRGTMKDSAGKTWLALDTSIKGSDYQWNAATDLMPEISLAGTRDSYLSAPHQQTPVEFLQTGIEEFLAANRPELAYANLLRVRTHAPELLKILPSSLQFREVKVTHELSSLPEELLHKVKVLAADRDGKQLFETTLETFKVSNRALVLSYEPENVEDQQIISAYGGLDNTPSYLVRLRPVLKLDGERVVVGTDGLPMGSDYTVTVSLVGPRGTETVSGNHIVGNLSVLSVVAQKSVTPAEMKPEEKDAERILFEEGVKYAGRWYEAEEQLASLLHLSAARPIASVAFIGGVIDVAYILDTPHGFAWKGVYLDAALRRIYAGTAKGNGDSAAAKRKAFMLFSALQGSVLEHRLFVDDFQVEAISTARLFGELGGQVLTIDSANIETLLPTLSFDDAIKADITQSVAQGYLVKIPAASASFQDWTGIGYIKENPATGESGYMLSGMIAGGMTAWGIDRWPAYYASLLTTPFAEPPNPDPSAAMYIMKVTSGDLQFVRVGERLPKWLQVRVTDNQGKAVQNAAVTFTMRAGGGHLVFNSGSYTTYTNRAGIASVSPTVGEKTAANPTYWWEDGYTYSQQIGENVIDATLASGTPLAKPFTAYAFPKAPHHLKKTMGDGVTRPILSHTGSLSVIVEDMYDNPISNKVVNFALQAARPKFSICTLPNQDSRQGYLIKTGDPCTTNLPVWGQCGTPTMTLQDTSSKEGAAVDLILGGVPDATYNVVVTSGNLTETFTQSSEPYGNCGGDQPPANMLYVTYSNPVDSAGNSIYAGKAGTAIPVTARVFYLREGEKEILETLSCSGPRVCTKIVGNRQYRVDTNFKSATVTFGGQPGVNLGGGLYRGQYTLAPGLNNIAVSATATVSGRKTYSICQLCNVIQTVDFTATTGINIPVYGVKIVPKPPTRAFLDIKGYSYNDVKVAYSIEPADYKAGSAYVVVTKNGETIASIPTELSGNGFATLAKGFWYDTNSSYEATVVLNYGWRDIELRGDKKSFALSSVNTIKAYDANNPCNKAPGNLMDDLIIGVDPANKARVAMHVELDPPVAVPELVWGLSAFPNGASPQSGNFLSGDPSSDVSALVTRDYKLSIGVDINGNGVFDSGDNIVRTFTVTVISKADFELSRQWLSCIARPDALCPAMISTMPVELQGLYYLLSATGAIDKPLGSSFLMQFIGEGDHAPIQPLQPIGAAPLAAGKLDLNAGAYLRADCSADIPELVYDKTIIRGPEMMAKIANAPVVRDLLEKTLRSQRADIVTWFNANPGLPYKTTKVEGGLNFRERIFGKFILNDLGLAYGTAAVKLNPVYATIESRNGNLCVNGVHVVGTVTDVYDWKWFQNDLFGKRAAVLQIGFGKNAVLGAAGQVFRSRAVLDENLDMSFCLY
jgi:Transglutaminase-like superfamily